MPSERRLICFSKREAGDAMRRFAASQERELPAGELADVTYAKANQDGVHVKLAFRNGSHQKELNFNEFETAAALIGYCASAKVPIPRQGRKSVRLVGGDLALQVDVSAH